MSAPKPIDYLPIWKKGASIAERFQELALMAAKHPDWFQKWILVYCEDNDDRFKTRYIQGDETRTSDCLAILSGAAMTIFEETSR